jgi:antirestriction protein
MVYGHTVYLDVPESLYPSDGEKRKNFQDQIKDDLDEIKNVPDEYMSAVFLGVEEAEDRDWRGESGILPPRQRAVNG